MRSAWGYLGALGLLVGTFLSLPDPHPMLSDATALVLTVGVALVAALAVFLGRELVAVAALAGAVLVTLPVEVPMLWWGPVLQVLGVLLVLEGARARGSGTTIPPPRTWVLPLAIALVGCAVVALALTNQSGRESLDMTQGVGLAVSAPFLLAAAYGIVRAVGQRGQGAAAALVGPSIAMLLAVVLVSSMAPGAQANHQNSASGNGFNSLSVLAQFQVNETQTMNVTQGSWFVNETNVLVMLPRLVPSDAREAGFDDIRNWTFSEGVLRVPMSATTNQNCSDRVFTLERLTGPFTEDSPPSQLPNGTDPVTSTRSEGQCLGGSTWDFLRFDVVEHLDAWANGTPVYGWKLSVGGADQAGSSGRARLDNTVFTTNRPTIGDLNTTPETQRVWAGSDLSLIDVVMAPVGGQVQVDVNITEPRGGLRNLSIMLGDGPPHGSFGDEEDDRFFNTTLNHTDRANISFVATETNVNGSLWVRVDDWDGNYHTRFIDNFRPDREDPVVAVNDTRPVTVQGKTLTLDEPLLEGTEQNLTLNLTDDSCWIVRPCITVQVLRGNGTELTNLSGPWDHNITLPTERPGLHILHLLVEDAADRFRLHELRYHVREQTLPTVGPVTAMGHAGRADLQEAGLPMILNVTASDETAPLEVVLSLGEDVLASDTIEANNGTARFSLALDEPGEQTLTVAVTDGWGNTATTTHAITTLPAAPPTVRLPTDDWVTSGRSLQVSVGDDSLLARNVTIELLSGGGPLAGADVDKSVTEDGVEATITLPDLLHGESVRLVVEATDRLGQTTTAQANVTADLQPPTLTVTPSNGKRVGADVWTTGDATVRIQAEDPDSGLALLELRQPTSRTLDPPAVLNISELGEQPLQLAAQDRVGNERVWEGQLRIDDTPPRLSLSVDGHDLVITVQEDQSGLERLRATARGEVLAVPAVTGTHRAPLHGVLRGDVVDVTVEATDSVGQTTGISRSVTVGDAPPVVELSTLEGRALSLSASDPDGDAVETTAIARHAVNGTEVELATDGDRITLPDWRGDVQVVVRATSHGNSTRATHNVTLGQGPFLHAQAPGEVRTDEPATVQVSWERAYESIHLVVTRDGSQVAAHAVENTGPGKGTVALALDEEGTYALELRGQDSQGTVDVTSVGTTTASSPFPVLFIVAGVLVLVLAAGLAALVYVRRDDDEDAA